jgi:hypothetical protein
MKREKIKGDKSKLMENKGPEPNFHANTSLDKTIQNSNFAMPQKQTTHRALKAILGPTNAGLGVHTPNENSRSRDWLRQANQFISNDSTLSFQGPKPSLYSTTICNMGWSHLSMMNSLSYMSSYPTEINNMILLHHLSGNAGSSSMALPCNVGSTTLSLSCNIGSVPSTTMKSIPLNMVPDVNMQSTSLRNMSNERYFNMLAENIQGGDGNDDLLPIPVEEGEELDFGGKTFCFTETRSGFEN